MVYAVWLATALPVGIASAWSAKKRGASPTLWFFIGAILHVFVFLITDEFQKRKGA